MNHQTSEIARRICGGHRARRVAYRPVAEPLEVRALMAVAIDVEPANNTIYQDVTAPSTRVFGDINLTSGDDVDLYKYYVASGSKVTIWTSVYQGGNTYTDVFFWADARGIGLNRIQGVTNGEGLWFEGTATKSGYVYVDFVYGNASLYELYFNGGGETDCSIQINSTRDQSDDVVLLNSPLTPDISARITGVAGGVYTLSMIAGAELAELSTREVTLGIDGTATIFIKPKAVSKTANDIIIQQDDLIPSTAGASTVRSREDMTVAVIDIPQSIRNENTPDEMADRIPPRTATSFFLPVSPNLNGSGLDVTLAVKGQENPDHGTVTINDSSAPLAISEGRDINLRGVLQTKASGGVDAGQLHLVVKVAGYDVLQSDGFSIAAIPINWHESFGRVLTGYGDGPSTYKRLGFTVAWRWQSDSGVLEDLDGLKVGEIVRTVAHGGGLAGTGGLSGMETIGTNDGAEDYLSSRVEYISSDGYEDLAQIHIINDRRTGSQQVPIASSGYLISRVVFQQDGIWYLSTSLRGQDVTALGKFSSAGIGSASLQQGVAVLAFGAGTLEQPYDGKQRSVAVLTSPPGLDVNIRYDGNSEPPSNIGRHHVTVDLLSISYNGFPIYAESITGELLITANLTQTLRWDSPNSIGYGTPLGPGQLNASVDAPPGGPPPGVLTYTLSDGTVLTAGMLLPVGTYKVVVTAAETDHYAAVSTTAHITVLSAAEQVNLLNGMVLDLIPLGLSLDQASNLTQKLLLQGSSKANIRKVQTFIVQLSIYLETGVLTESQVDPLAAWANSLLRTLALS